VTIRAANFPAEALTGLAQWGKDIQMDGEHINMIIPSDAVLPEITRYLVARHAEVYAITPNRMSLEDIFIETVGEDGGL